MENLHHTPRRSSRRAAFVATARLTEMLTPARRDVNATARSHGDEAAADETVPNGGEFRDEDSLSSAESSEADEVECPICLEEIVAADIATIDSCDHVFCRDCVTQWSETHNICPLCRTRFNTIESSGVRQRVPDRRPAIALNLVGVFNIEEVGGEGEDNDLNPFTVMLRQLLQIQDVQRQRREVQEMEANYRQQMEVQRQQMQELNRQMEQSNREIQARLREFRLRAEQLHVGADRAPEGIVQLEEEVVGGEIFNDPDPFALMPYAMLEVREVERQGPEERQQRMQEEMEARRQQMQELNRQMEQNNDRMEQIIDQNSRQRFRQRRLRAEQLHGGEAERAPEGIVQQNINADVGVAEPPAELAELNADFARVMDTLRSLL